MSRVQCQRVLVIVSCCIAAVAIGANVDSDAAFRIAYAPGTRDVAGRFMGGTEIRALTAHSGRLYAGNGYWQDRPGPEGPQGAQILVLDAPDGAWRVDHAFDERMPNGRARDLAVSALTEVRFTTDASGAPLPKPVAMLVASTWDLTGATRVFSRDDATGAWVATTLARDAPAPNFLPQVRSFGTHRDRVTAVDHLFAGQDPRGIFRGSYDATVAGGIAWTSAPELDISRIDARTFPGLAGMVRVTSFAECSGRLYAAVGQQVYERIDGPTPGWQLVYTNPRPYRSESGLRGLTTVVDGGGHEMLLAAVEGVNARIVRIDPRDGSETTELDLTRFLGDAWKMRVGYSIAAYNDMTAHGDMLLLGLEAFIAPGAAIADDHRIVDVGYGRLDADAWYLVRHADGRYDLHRIAVAERGAGAPRVATRTIRVSPFPNDDAIYLGGYDANKYPAHDTAWIARAGSSVVTGATR
jgi:hypothetical protein